MNAVLTGHIGRKASAALRAAGIRIYVGASGRLKDAVAAFKEGKLEEKA